MGSPGGGEPTSVSPPVPTLAASPQCEHDDLRRELRYDTGGVVLGKLGTNNRSSTLSSLREDDALPLFARLVRLEGLLEAFLKRRPMVVERFLLVFAFGEISFLHVHKPKLIVHLNHEEVAGFHNSI